MKKLPNFLFNHNAHALLPKLGYIPLYDITGILFSSVCDKLNHLFNAMITIPVICFLVKLKISRTYYSQKTLRKLELQREFSWTNVTNKIHIYYFSHQKTSKSWLTLWNENKIGDYSMAYLITYCLFEKNYIHRPDILF